MMNRQHLLILFGGQSSEHEVSCRSAVTVIQAVNQEKYEMMLVGITKEGAWIQTDSVEQIQDGTWREGTARGILSPDATKKGIWLMKEGETTFWPVDVAFPVLHGLRGEDGTIQGLFELAKIPYVGCGVLASAVSMDKVYTKKIVDTLGVRQAAYVVVHREECKTEEKLQNAIARVEAKLSYPVFVKPSCAGSSCGVSKASNREELIDSLNLAAGHDRKILVEETIQGRELECAVLGGVDPKASGIGEILAAAAFYDYEAKYNSADSRTIVNPKLPEGAAEKIREAAVAIFQAVDGWGLSRVDFFLEEGSNEVVFNEINTMPGFTSISMYPMLWEEKGMSVPQLVERLIQYALVRE
jgi:D-alanine-D-alanine ligase